LEVAADDDNTGDVQGSIPGVAPDGTVYVLYGRRIFNGPARGRLEVVRSATGGATFGRPRVVAQITSIPFFLPNGLPDRNFRTPGSLPAFAVSPADGNLYAAWADYRHEDSDIFFARSTDRGNTWSRPVRLNDDPVENGIDQFHPQVAVAPNGRVAVMWMDRRLPCPDLPWIQDEFVGQGNACIDTFLTRSTDGGLTWEPNIRASAQTWDWRINLPMVNRNTGFIGDYQGLASSNGYDYPVWSATANLGDNPRNRQQVFVARVPADWVPPTPGGPTDTPWPTPTIRSSTPTASPTATRHPTATGSPTPSGTPRTPTSTAGSPPTALPSPDTPVAPVSALYVPFCALRDAGGGL
jgi:hypothetical protein